MDNSRILRLIGLITWVVYSIFIVWSSSLVPFHPDESTQIYMSSDFEQLFTSPSVLFWNPTPADAQRQHYRELDAPITRWMIGFSRFVFKIPPQSTDWDWSTSWSENASAGALPDSTALFIARLFPALMLPISILLIYSTGKQLIGPLAGTSAAVFIALNPIILLHARRAMAEGGLLFFSCLFLWLATRKNTHPGWLALAGALAFNCKQSGIVLVLAGAIIILYQTIQSRTDWKRILLTLFGYAALILLITYLLNPYLWKLPLQAVTEALQNRLAFSEGQASLFSVKGSSLAIDSLPKGFLVLLYQLLFAPLAFYDSGNYISQLSSSIQAYESTPLQTSFTYPLFSGLALSLILIGIILSILDIQQKKVQPVWIRVGVILLCIVIFLTTGLSIGFQRYYILIYPILAILVGLGIDRLIFRFYRARGK